MKRSRSHRGLIESLEGRTLLSLVFNELTPLPDNVEHIVQFRGAYYYYSPAEKGIYKTDGTTAGTALVHKFVNAGPVAFSGFSNLQALPNTMVFTIDDNQHGEELWVSDGTDTGTVLLKDINPDGAWSSPNQFEALNGRLFFAADDGTHGEELWVTDGTALGTQLVADVNTLNNGANSSSISDLTAAGNLLLFQANHDGVHPYALWRSDGTAVGTFFVADMLPASNPSGPQEIVGLPNGQALVIANDAQLWVTNGTTASLVNGAPGVSDISDLEAVGSLGVFTGVSNDETIVQLWASDGTPGGTTVIHTFPEGAELGSFDQVGNSLFFTLWVDNNNLMLWKTDGTAAGTVPVQTVTNARDFEAADGSMFYLVPRTDSAAVTQAFQVWQINGAGQSFFQGEVPVKSDPNASPDLAVVGDKAFVTLTDDAAHVRFFGSAVPTPFSILGTKKNDTLSVTQKGDTLTYILNGKKKTVARSSFSTLRIDMGAGNDRVVIGKNVTGVYVSGGVGNDILIGSAGDNVLDGGPGNDLLVGRGGVDKLTGGLGKDVIVTGGGNDVLVGSVAKDKVNRQAIGKLAAADNASAFFKNTQGMTAQDVFDEIIQPDLAKVKARAKK